MTYNVCSVTLNCAQSVLGYGLHTTPVDIIKSKQIKYGVGQTIIFCPVVSCIYLSFFLA